MDCKLIENTSNVFISNGGYCFSIINGNEIRIPSRMNNGTLKVKINNTRVSIADLLVKYFMPDENIDGFTRIKFKIVDGCMPLKHIKILREDSKDIDRSKMFMYKCKEKAISNNSRTKNENKITDVDVYSALVVTNFTCFYCGTELKTKTWELDHVHPISKGGLNDKSNIIPACKECNRMKGSMMIEKFLYQAELVSNKNKDNSLLPQNNQLSEYRGTIAKLKAKNVKLELKIEFLTNKLLNN